MRGRWSWCTAALALAACLDEPPAAVSGDATPAEGDAAPVTCSAGKVIAPASASNASPLDPASACGIENALESDGVEAGLDRFDDGPDACASLAPETTEYGGCGCVAVDFRSALPLARLTVRARWTPDACGYACTACDAGHVMTVWTAEEGGAYRFIDNVGLIADTLDDYDLAIDTPTRFVAVCRDWWGEDRADVAVDSISGTCAE